MNKINNLIKIKAREHVSSRARQAGQAQKHANTASTRFSRLQTKDLKLKLVDKSRCSRTELLLENKTCLKVGWSRHVTLLWSVAVTIVFSCDDSKECNNLPLHVKRISQGKERKRENGNLERNNFNFKIFCHLQKLVNFPTGLNTALE